MRGFGIIREKQTVGWIEKDIPKPGPFDAIMTPVAVCPCTSDVHSARSANSPASVVLGKVGEKRDDIILGHEAVGRIVEIGSMVTDFKVGDVVAVPCCTPVWRTLEVQEGLYQHSGGQAGSRFSSLRFDGVFAEYFRVNDVDMNCALIPDGVSIASAVLATDMITTGFHGAELADVKFGDTVVVIGIGPVGLMAIAGSALRGAGRIFGIGDRPVCRQLAKEYGAEATISYRDGSTFDQLMEITGGEKADAVIVAGGNESTITEALRMLKVGGRLGNLVGQAGDIVISGADFNIMCGHKNVIGGLCPGGRRRMERLMSIVRSGRLNPDLLITHELHGMDAIEEGFHLMAGKDASLIKPIVYIEK